MKKFNFKLSLIALILILAISLCGCEVLSGLTPLIDSAPPISPDAVPEYTGSPYIVINGNIPFFTDDEITDISYERYGELDNLGRATAAISCIGTDLMPMEERDDLDYKPTGWHTVKYDCVDGKYLYNRCHLIGFQLTGENDNRYNLITGTRYLNIEGMLNFENDVKRYIDDTKNHVMYRVTPIFEGDELVARGVLMEGLSVEDAGVGIRFCIYAYNVQPGVIIDYATGASREDKDYTPSDEPGNDELSVFIVNLSSLKFHIESCRYANAKNTKTYTTTAQELIYLGYSPCSVCQP